MKTIFLAFLLATTIFDSCEKRCPLPAGYAGNTILVPGGPPGGLPLQTSGSGEVIVEGYNCNEIKVFDGAGNPLPTYNTD